MSLHSFNRRCAQAQRSVEMGCVYLIGAGPGDPELLTIKAARLISEADVIFYDRLVHPDVVNMSSSGCEKIYVGKQCGKHAVPQERICALLAAKASAGKKVVRVKGGDPYIFGRGGEEADVLAAAGVPFAVVPGITAATGCAAYTGIPLTHRDLAHRVEFVTGRLTKAEDEPNWTSLIDDKKTLVFYMGLKQLPKLVDRLMTAGKAGSTPVALIDGGTNEDQQNFISTLAEVVDYSRSCSFSGPTLIVIGDVVGRRQAVNLDLLNAKQQSQNIEEGRHN